MTIPAEKGKVAIVVGGGPAPGINGVIHSATLHAQELGYEVIGLRDGYRWLCEGQKKIINLNTDLVSRIHLEGGSILGTARTNPTKKEALLKKVVCSLVDMGVTKLVSIGGDDTAFSAYKVGEYASKNMGVTLNCAHVPKTIDNDLPLPEGIPTFGYETARQVGTYLLTNLMNEAKTSSRWVIAVAMGRSAGHLALGMGKSSGATLTLIPEEWNGAPVRLPEVVDIILGSIIKRLVHGRPYGVVVLAEGLMEYMDHSDLKMLDRVEKDAHGHIRLAEIKFGDMIKDEVKKQVRKMKVEMTTAIDKEIGYELRCAAPTALDIEYTINLGHSAMEFLHNGGTNALITVQGNQVVPIPFSEIMDPQTGKTQVRQVDINSLQFKIAREYMIRLEPSDFDSNIMLEKMAMAANMTSEQFVDRFGYLVGRKLSPHQ